MRPRSHRVLFLAGQCRAHSMEPGGKCGRPRACQTPTEWPNPFSDPDTVPVTPERLSGLRLGLCPSGLVGLMSGRLGGRIAFSIYGKAFSQGAPGVLDAFLWPPEVRPASYPETELLGLSRGTALLPASWGSAVGSPGGSSEGGERGAGSSRARCVWPRGHGSPQPPSPPSPLRPLQMSGIASWGLALPQGLPAPHVTFTAGPFVTPSLVLIGKPSLLDFSIMLEL